MHPYYNLSIVHLIIVVTSQEGKRLGRGKASITYDGVHGLIFLPLFRDSMTTLLENVKI